MKQILINKGKSKNTKGSSRGKKYIQPKLEINTPGDRFEKEADAVAEHVTNTAKGKPPFITGPLTTSINKKCEECEKEENGLLMRKSTSGSNVAESGFESGLMNHRSGGTPLTGTIKNEMEQSFGADFSNVRIHTDVEAAEMNKEIHARAFTYGNDIYFGRSKYSDKQPEGKKLIAHELTHVLQQRGGISANRQISPSSMGIYRDVLADETSKKQGSKTPLDTDAAADRLVKLTVEEVDGSAREKVLIAIFVTAMKGGTLKRWAYILQGMLRQDGTGNYLWAFYLKVKESSNSIAVSLANILVKQGIAIGPTSGSFRSLNFLDPKVDAPRNTAVDKAPAGHWVDAFDHVKYDLYYNPDKKSSLSSLLQVYYKDGTKIDIHIREISDNIDPAPRNAIAQAYIGPGSRIFPSRMSRTTTPRLWREKQKAIAVMNADNEDFEFFVSLGLAGVMSNLPIGPVPVETEVPVGSPARSSNQKSTPPITEGTPVAKPPEPVIEKPVTPPAKPPARTVDEFVAQGGKIKKIDPVKSTDPQITAQPKQKPENKAVFGEGPEVDAIKPTSRKKAGVKYRSPAPERGQTRPPLPEGQNAERAELSIFKEPFKDPAALSEQDRILNLAKTEPQKAGSEYENLTVQDFKGGETAQNKFRRPGRRMDLGNQHEITIEGREGEIGKEKLNQLWDDFADNGNVILTVPKLSAAARDQLSRLLAQARKTFGSNLILIVRETLP